MKQKVDQRLNDDILQQRFSFDKQLKMFVLQEESDLLPAFYYDTKESSVLISKGKNLILLSYEIRTMEQLIKLFKLFELSGEALIMDL